jgi:WD40 repeat-containing protein SMU1
MELAIQGVDVVRVLLQFCQENGLSSTFAALQEESQVSLNAVESVDAFVHDIRTGRWDAVMQTASTLSLPRDKLLALYEQLVLELVERRDCEVARQVMRTAEPLVQLSSDKPDRYRVLESLIAKPYFDQREAYPEGTSRDGRRAALAELLASEVVEVPPSRLLALFGQALKWQRLNGMLPPGGKLDLFRNAPPTRVREEEAHPTRALKELSFGKRSHPEIARFSPDGLWLVSGSSDGFIEVRDSESGKVSKALQYQAEDALMMHDAAVLAVDFSADSELLATGCQVRTAPRAALRVCANWRAKQGPDWLLLLSLSLSLSLPLSPSLPSVAVPLSLPLRPSRPVSGRACALCMHDDRITIDRDSRALLRAED